MSSHSYSHLSTETHTFLDSLSLCWTRFSEDALLDRELILLKSKFQGIANDISPSQLRQYIIRSIFLEMLGYETSFIYIYAINLTQSQNFSLKKLGYLACCLFLNETSELLILLISPIQKDLQSNKYEYVKVALSATSKLLCPDLIENIYPLINNLLKHEKREIRVKALMLLYQMYKYSPSLITSFNTILKTFLKDKHLKTLLMVSNIIYDEAIKKPGDFIDILDELIQILENIFNNKLREDQGFYKIKVKVLSSNKTSIEVPPPWIIIKLLQVLEVLVGENLKNSEKIYRILSEILKEYSNLRALCTDSIVFQCMKSILNIFPNEELIIRCCDTVSIFLDERNELKYMGIKTLLYLSEQNLKYINQYQDEIMACLENQDFMIKRKTLLLLIKIANLQNISIVLPKLLKYLQMENDVFFKKLLICKIFELFKKYTPSPQFFLLFGSEFLKFGGNLIDDDIKNEVIRMIQSIYLSDPQKMGSVITNFYKDLMIYEKNLPENLIQISCWILGEIGSETYKNNNEMLETFSKTIQEKFLVNIYEKNTMSWLLNSLVKLNNIDKLNLTPLLKRFRNSKDHDLAQRIKEFEKISQTGFFLKESQILCNINKDLPFLNEYVDKFKLLGYKTYEKSRNTIEIKKNVTNVNDEITIHFEGKKMWGDNIYGKNIELNNNNEKKSQTHHSNSITPIKEKKSEENKPIALQQTPTEEFASKVFKGIFDESRSLKTKIFGMSHQKNITIPKLDYEGFDFNLNNNEDKKKNIKMMIGNFQEFIKYQDLETIESMFSSLPITNEIQMECDNLGKEQINKLADNFSLRLFVKETDLSSFIMTGIKSEQIVVCLGNEGLERLKLRFKSTSLPILSNLIEFIKEYINQKGFKIFLKN